MMLMTLVMVMMMGGDAAPSKAVYLIYCDCANMT